MSGRIKIGVTVETPHGNGIVVSEEVFKGSERWGVKLDNNPFSFPVAFFFKNEVEKVCKCGKCEMLGDAAPCDECYRNGNEVKPTLAAVLDPNVSMRCGKSVCEFYNKHNKVSGCHKFDDRRKCSLSMKQRRKAKNKAKKRDRTNWWGC